MEQISTLKTKVALSILLPIKKILVFPPSSIRYLRRTWSLPYSSENQILNTNDLL